jgi:hypothetical protein
MVSKEQRSTVGRSLGRPSPAAGNRASGGAGWLAWPTAVAATASLAVALGLSAVPGAAASNGGKLMSTCPKRAKAALPLSAHVTKKAAQAALVAAPKPYKGLNVKDATIVWSRIATAAGPRGGEVAFQCGKTIHARTIVVELRFPKELPSASLSEGVVFVSRFKSGYQVWEVAH